MSSLIGLRSTQRCIKLQNLHISNRLTLEGQLCRNQMVTDSDQSAEHSHVERMLNSPTRRSESDVLPDRSTSTFVFRGKHPSTTPGATRC